MIASKKYLIRLLLALLAVTLILVLFAPLPRFEKPCSTVVLAADGQLLGARIASDGQWRFPTGDTVPEKFKTCLITFEDRYFRYHPGVNLFAIGRAMMQNLREKRVVSGGSTITMQVARMAGNRQKRTIGNKLIEMISAMKLELLKSKEGILAIYAANAPFGGNTVGIEAACWRYFAHSASHLSWAEAATLAILPNAPSLIFPGNNDQKLKIKRDKLLRKLFERNIIDSLDFRLALDEPVPGKPFQLPDHSFHLTERLKKSNPGERIMTSINYELQQQIRELVRDHTGMLATQYIFNAAAMVVDVRTNQVKAYIGNAPTPNASDHHNQVDMITSKRSTGSILKPFLYAAMLSDGEMLPNAILPDIPVYLSGYAPKNFDYSFHGAVPASQALSWSLNIPSVYMLKRYGTDRFMDKLRKFGFTTFDKSSDHYGLSLILGGGETSLWELCSAYGGLSRTLNQFHATQKYYAENFDAPSLTGTKQDRKLTPVPGFIDADAIWFTFQALLDVNRPDGYSGWEYFQSSRRVAWKTGTSFGFRDAWAVATTPDYVIGVWVGNSSGEGRPGLTGVTSAAPLLFHILNLLPESQPHPQPGKEATYAEVCSQSGYRLGKHCKLGKTMAIPEKGLKTESCPYCQTIAVSENPSDNKSGETPKTEKWFVLPPAMEFYFRKYNPSYLPLPVNALTRQDDYQIMEFIYPGANDKIYIPRTIDGQPGNMVFEVAHRDASARLFWHLDNRYIGTTTYIHQMPLSPSVGQHQITLTDEHGHTLKRLFTVLNATTENDEN